MRSSLVATLAWLVVANAAMAGDREKTILLIGKDRDHPYATHEYMVDCRILAKSLEQTPGVKTIVSNGWPKDRSALANVNAIVLHTRNGGDVLLSTPYRKQLEKMLADGIGFTAIHWSTGAGAKNGEQYLGILGGWFNTKFSRYLVRTVTLEQADPKHPTCRGWKPFKLRDEYYIKLKFAKTSKPVFTAMIDKTRYTIGWVYERPDSQKGRSFGFVCGHFHANFGEPAFRRAIVNGVLWTAHLDVPTAGASVMIAPIDMKLPPKGQK